LKSFHFQNNSRLFCNIQPLQEKTTILTLAQLRREQQIRFSFGEFWNKYIKKVPRPEDTHGVVYTVPRFAVFSGVAVLMFVALLTYMLWNSSDSRNGKKRRQIIYAETGVDEWSIAFKTFTRDKMAIPITIVGCIFWGSLWGYFRSARMLKTLPHFQTLTYSGLLKDPTAASFIYRNIILTSTLSLVILFGGSVGGPAISWAILRPTEEEVEKKELDVTRLNKAIMSKITGQIIFPLLVGSSCLCVQPYLLIPMSLSQYTLSMIFYLLYGDEDEEEGDDDIHQ